MLSLGRNYIIQAHRYPEPRRFLRRYISFFFSGYAMALKMDVRLFASVVVVLNLFIIVPRSCGALRTIKIGE